MNILFEKANHKYKETIFKWLDKPHIIKYWDNSNEHREDILIFLDDRKIQSGYFAGHNSYLMVKNI